jgi:preprotein translocase subunit SecE
MAKTSPSEFVNQVQTEAKKIVWPTGRETIMTAIMVVIMTSLLGIFFFTVGMSIDIREIAREPLMVLGGIAGHATRLGGRTLRQIHGLGVHRCDLGPRT